MIEDSQPVSKLETTRKKQRFCCLVLGWPLSACFAAEIPQTSFHADAKRSVGSVLPPVTRVSRILCAQECARLKTCFLFSFHADASQCQMFGESSTGISLMSSNTAVFVKTSKTDLIGNTNTHKKHNVTKILMLPSSLRSTVVIHLSNWLQESYCCLNMKGTVKTALYVASIDRLVVSMNFPHALYSVELESKEYEVLLSNDGVLAMTEDELNKRLFVIVSKRSKSLGRLDLDSEVKTITTVLTKDWRQRDITLDSKTRRLYIACVIQIVSVTMEGKDVKILKRSNDLYTVQFDPKTNCLYYNENRRIWVRCDGKDRIWKRRHDKIISDLWYTQGMVFVEAYDGPKNCPRGVYTPDGFRKINSPKGRCNFATFALIP